MIWFENSTYQMLLRAPSISMYFNKEDFSQEFSTEDDLPFFNNIHNLILELSVDVFVHTVLERRYLHNRNINPSPKIWHIFVIKLFMCNKLY